ncbi:MAG: hypothetical protein RL172_1214 [Bacteroidota bacterium]|jgi:hypothetical protein
MKTFCVLLLVFSCLTACKKESGTQAVSPMQPGNGQLPVLYRGVFMNGPYGQASGIAKVVVKDDLQQLLLDSFVVTGGPDLHVYLSKEVQPLNFIDLGKLKFASGSQLYTIPANTNYADYQYALIHCQQYNHLFGSATIK